MMCNKNNMKIIIFFDWLLFLRRQLNIIEQVFSFFRKEHLRSLLSNLLKQRKCGVQSRNRSFFYSHSVFLPTSLNSYYKLTGISVVVAEHFFLVITSSVIMKIEHT